MTKAGGRSKSGPGPGRFLPPCGGRSIIAIEVVAFPAAASASRKGTISATGRKGDRRRFPISRCSVAGITARSTRRATESIAGSTARFGSVGRMADPCPRSHRRPRCPPIRSALSAGAHDFGEAEHLRALQPIGPRAGELGGESLQGGRRRWRKSREPVCVLVPECLCPVGASARGETITKLGQHVIKIEVCHLGECPHE